MRPELDAWALSLAVVTSERSTCARRAVGCVLLDARGRVLATGYNGVARGLPHCRDGTPCPGADASSGERLDACGAIHAEQNALLQCADVEAVRACYVTVSPCVHCVKMLMNTGCRRVVFVAPYVHEAPSRALWESGPGRTWELFDHTPPHGDDE